MDPQTNQQIDQRLQAIEKKLDENTFMVRKLYRVQRRATMMKVFYWVVLIVISIISISLIKPYLSQLGEAYGLGAGSTKDKSGSSYSDLLKTLNE